MNEECVCPGLRLACREAFVLFGRALRWGICLKSVVVARLTCLCLDFCFFAVGQFWVCGILVRVFCWAIAGREYSFLLIFGFVCSFFGGRGGLGVYSFW